MRGRGLGVEPETVERIRALAAAGLRRREAAEQIGMSFSTLAKIAARNRIEFHGKPAHPNSQRWAYRKPVPAKPDPIGNTTDEIARYIAERGVTRCPPAYAAPSPQGART
jgi:hypothetical protein